LQAHRFGASLSSDHNLWMLLNQYSGLSATIKGGNCEPHNGASIVQYAWIPNDQSRLWTFVPVQGTSDDNPQFYIKNLYSEKYIAFNGPDRNNNAPCVQMDDPDACGGRWMFDTELFSKVGD